MDNITQLFQNLPTEIKYIIGILLLVMIPIISEKIESKRENK